MAVPHQRQIAEDNKAITFISSDLTRLIASRRLEASLGRFYIGGVIFLVLAYLAPGLLGGAALIIVACRARREDLPVIAQAIARGSRVHNGRHGHPSPPKP